MNRKLLTILLLISLAFNLAVIGTFAYRYTLHRKLMNRHNTEDVRENLQTMKSYRPNIHRKFRDNIRPLHDLNRELRTAFLQELIKPEPNYDTLATISTEIEATTKEISNNFYKEMIETRKTLTPEEAEELFQPQLRMQNRRSSFSRDEDGEHRQQRRNVHRRHDGM
ncbi:MAG: hypothetical protein WC155_08310 [Candidatus Cloacimonadales bacterium]